MIDFRFGRVDVLGKFLVLRAEHTSTEGNHFARKRVNGKHDTSPKAVAQLMVVRFITESGLYQELLFEPFAQCLLCQCIAPLGAETQLELINDIVTETPLAEISQSDAASVYMVFQDILKVVAGEVVDNEHTFAVALHLFLFIGQLPFLDFYVILLGQVAECLGIGHLFVFHDEVHRVAALAATETLAKSLGGRHAERGSFLVMERAKSHVVHTAFAQRDEVRNHFYDLCGIEYTVYGCLIYHCFISLRMQMYVIFLG